MYANKIALNIAKAEAILFRHQPKIIDYGLKIKLNGKRIAFTNKVKYLGIELDEHLSWSYHTNSIASKLRKANGIISKVRHYYR